MSEELLINFTPRETRVAHVENGMLQEVYVERARKRGLVGNVYKGRVQRVMPGMQAAFIEIGLERAAFLHVSDLIRPNLEPPPVAVAPLLEPPVEPVEHDSAQVNPAPAAAVIVPPAPPLPSISELVREGQEIVVQVVKDPIGSKGARLTTHISIPSRYLVLLPNTRMVGVSVRIEEEAERQRLKQLLGDIAQSGPHGYIVRTNAEGVEAEALRSDVAYLDKLWHTLNEDIPRARPGDCVYEDLPLALRALRDLLRGPVERVRIDSRETWEKAQKFAEQFMPAFVERIEHYPGERPIFDLYGIEDEIQKALKKEAPLKSGGYLILDQTEAMTTIDVNTGGFLGHRNLEETVYRTNLEAAQTIARQLRLRNLGGIIIIDFIDMTDEEHRRQVIRTLEKALARDHAKTTVYEMSALGLVQMTRKRTTESLERQLCEPCPTCNGRGAVKSAETMCYELFREITRAVRQFEAQSLLVLANTTVVNRIVDEENSALAELEAFIGKTIRFQAEEQYGPEQYDVVLI